MRAVKHFILLTLLLITSSCDKPNVLTEYSKTDSDEALFLEARKRMDNFEWDKAISILTSDLTPEYRNTSKVKERLMHAYGGKCGISFFDMIHSLKSMNSTSMFDIALKVFDQKVVNVAACDAAIGVLHELGPTSATRTHDQNTFAAILGLTQMGTTIKAKFDRESSGLGDGSVDSGWNACEISSATLRLSDDDVNRVATGVGLIFENLLALGDSLTSGSAGGAFDDARALCETPLNLPTILQPHDYDPSIAAGTSWTAFGLPASPTYTDFGLPADIAVPLSCTNTFSTAVPNKMRRLMRRLIASSDIGFGGTSGDPGCNLSSVNAEAKAVPNPAYDNTQPISPTNTPQIIQFKIKSACCEDLAVP